MANNPNAAANLRPKPWKKGQSGNPKGRPSMKPIEEAFQEFLAADHDHKGKSKQRLEWLIERVFTDAMNGKPQAQALAFDRAFGKAKQDMTLSGPNGGAIPVEITVNHVKSNGSEG